MAEVNAGTVSISRDGFMAGPNQSESDPLGMGGRQLHEWMFATPSTATTMDGERAVEGGDEVFDDASDVRATIMGRNMFGPIRGPWQSSEWRGWWGDEPPYGHRVFVLTHHERADVAVGATTFHFITGGIDDALRRARDAAGDYDVHVSGGASTLRQYLREGLIDVLRVAVVPLDLHDGARLVEAGSWPDGYVVRRTVTGAMVTHYELVRG